MIHLHRDQIIIIGDMLIPAFSETKKHNLHHRYQGLPILLITVSTREINDTRSSPVSGTGANL